MASVVDQEKQFFQERRMFAIRRDELHIAPANLTMGHAGWFFTMKWFPTDTNLDDVVRGFYHPQLGLFGYKGLDMSHLGVVKGWANHFQLLVDNLHVPETAEVWLGARIPAHGPWKGLVFEGNVEDHLERLHHKGLI